MSVKIDGSGIITGLDADGISAQPVFPGNVLQVVSTTKTDTFSTTSTTFTDVSGLSASITPSSASSKILIIANIVVSQTGASSFSGTQLVRNATNIFVGTSGTRNFSTLSIDANDFGIGSDALVFLDTPNTTSNTVYKLQVRTGAGTTVVNRTARDTNDCTASTITLMEIAG
jgi:hypothetical protein